ncbi:hypothetical protein [Bacillus solimangrovi]|uniref:Uncharacterized protein n=1 Tax=Bacillus solimangrovi TaxID=1305675 RepID=A0A1E5LFY9_9BACI|nr:hypothetical protein [Bacillus solimangrovi]OEH92983.1 hypothetical protein BFG57_14045 [Bacillus solimangrovi]
MIDANREIRLISEALRRSKQQIHRLSLEQVEREKIEQRLIKAEIDCQRAFFHATKININPVKLKVEDI